MRNKAEKLFSGLSESQKAEVSTKSKAPETIQALADRSKNMQLLAKQNLISKAASLLSSAATFLTQGTSKATPTSNQKQDMSELKK